MAVVLLILWMLAITCIVISVACLMSIFDLFPKTREKIKDQFDNVFGKLKTWYRLRPLRRHLQGYDIDKVIPSIDMDDPADSLHRTGQQQALIMLKEIVDNEQPINIKQVIEAQLYETARHCPRSKEAMMFTWELVKVLKK